MTPARPGFQHKGVLIMGVIVIVSGAISVLLGIIQIGIRSPHGRIGFGIWCGVFFVVTGILGVTSWKYKNTANIVALMVMCILTAVLASVELVLACATLTADHRFHDGHNSYRNYMCRPDDWCTWAVPLEALLIADALFVLVVAIVCSAFCCKAVCCGRPTQPGMIVAFAPTQQQQGMVGQPGTQPVLTQQQYVVQGSGQPSQFGVVTMPDGSVQIQGQAVVLQAAQAPQEDRGQDEGFGYAKFN